MKSRKENVISNLVWRFAERCGAQGVSFVVAIILARLLSPKDYGLIALVTVFTNIFCVFVDSGLASALIQKKDADDLDFSSVFYFNVGWCVLLYLILYFVAPYISAFYAIPELTSIVRVLGILLIISGVKNVQQAYVSRTMQFKKFFFATLGGTIGAAIVGIWMAYHGYGVWSLVAQQIFNSLVDTIVLWMTVKWRPYKCFSISRLKGLLSYGWKLLVSALIDVLYNDIRSLIIGKWYSAEDLAFYNKGQSWPSIVIVNINSSISSILFPIMSSEQDNQKKIKNITRKSIKLSTYIMAPMMMGLCVCALPLTRLFLTDKWIPSIPYMRIFCITYMFYPIHTANLSAIKAMGRSDLFLKLEIVKKVIGLIVLLVTMRYGVLAMAYSLLFTSIASQIINSWPNKKLMDYPYLEQLKDILPSILLSMVMGGCVQFITLFNLPDMVILVIQVVLGVAIYIIGSCVLKLDSFQYLWEIAKPILFKHKA